MTSEESNKRAGNDTSSTAYPVPMQPLDAEPNRLENLSVEDSVLFDPIREIASQEADTPAWPMESLPPQPPTPRQLHGEVWALAWPSVMAMLLQTVNSLMDVFFVGHLPHPAQALAATGVGGGVMFLLISLAMGVSVGTTALVARFTGAEDHESSIHATGQSLTLTALVGFVVGILVYMGREPLVGWMLDARRSPEAALLCAQFLGIALLAAVPLFLLNVLMGAFRGLGDTRTPLLITCATIATHVSCNYVLIYGRFGFPAMGVRGAAAALTLSIVVGVFLYLFALAKSPLGVALQGQHLRLQSEWAWRLLKIGIPAAVQAVVRNLGMMSFTGMLAHTLEGASGVAALQIGVRAEAIAFMPGFGYSVAASALVGQSLGAKDPERAERYGWAATWQAMLVMSLMACLFFALADWFPHLFTDDPMVQKLGADYLRINAFCEPFLALGMVLTGALQGAGDTIRPTYLTFLTMWVARLPLAWLLMFPFHLNTRGAWLAMCLTTILGGILTAALFRSGKWKRIKV